MKSYKTLKIKQKKLSFSNKNFLTFKIISKTSVNERKHMNFKQEQFIFYQNDSEKKGYWFDCFCLVACEPLWVI